MIIGIISDTHDLLRPEVTGNLTGCDGILHAGDISSPEILKRLEAIAPVWAVRGNNDKEWAEDLPHILDLSLGGLRLCMTHKKKDLPRDLGPYGIAVVGHSHQYASAVIRHDSGKETMLLNPGSCGPRRFTQPITMAVLDSEPGGWTVRRVDIPHAAAEKAPAAGGDIRRQIEVIMKGTDKGLPPEAIAQRHRFDQDLTEQIARLYVTHPGVTADGIMTKLGLLGKL